MSWFKAQSFRSRLTLQWLLVFGVLLALALTGVYFGLRRSLYHSLEESLRTLAGTEIASSLDGPKVHLHPIESSAILKSHYVQKFVQILSPQSEIVQQSPELPNRPLVSTDTVQTALRGQGVLSTININGWPGLALAVDAQRQYVFVVVVPLSHIEETLLALRRTLLLVGFLALAATAFVGYRLATHALLPVDLMTQRAQLIGRDHLKARLVEPETDDELSRLAHVLNDMLERLYEIIESQQRFAADASHELRTPLTALRARLEIALRHPRSAEAYHKTLTQSLAEVEQLIQLAEDLLDLARADAHRLTLDLSEFALAPLINEELAHCQPAAALHNVNLKSTVAPDLLLIADEARLRRVVRNLLSNAIHYSRPDQGKVEISAGQGPQEVWIEIADDGIGWEAEQQENLFKRFWRGSAARQQNEQGAGLGLAICREIMRAHGGQIIASSQPNCGSRFRLCLPMQIET